MFTAIREGIYSESVPMYPSFPDLEDLPEELKIPHDGSGAGIVFAEIDDFGEATAKLVKENLNGITKFQYKDQIMLLNRPRV